LLASRDVTVLFQFMLERFIHIVLHPTVTGSEVHTFHC